MAERLAYLEAVVGADITEFRKSMRTIRNDVGILSETISGIGGAARTMTFAFTAPMVALGTYAVQAASGFDAAMRNINSIMQLSETQFAGLSEEVMNFAKTTRAGVVPATEALYEIFSAGITDQTRAMEVWKISNKVAEAGVADLTQTTNAMTATMSAYNLETDQATRVGNVWSQMVKMGVGSLGDFLSNSQKILPLSAAMNISLEDMGATLAFLSQGGGGAAKAETAYAMMLSNMLKPAEAMTSTFKKLGVVTGTELVEKFGSVSGAVMALKQAVDETTFNKMFSKTGLEAALRITGSFNQMTKATKDFNEGLDTATLDAWEEQSKSFAFQFDLMKTSLEAVAITIGQAIMPLITPIVQGFSGFLQQLTEVNPQLVQLGVIFVGVIAAAAPIIWLLTSMISPIGVIIAGVTALSAAFATNFMGIRDTVAGIVSGIVGDLQPLKDTINEFMDTIFPTQEEVDSAGGDNPTVDVTKHITVTKPMSLWEIYKEQGYDTQFSWEEFMKEARKGGWEGGVVNVGDMITLSGGKDAGRFQGLAMADGMREGYRKGDKIDAKEMIPPNLFERISTAVTNAWPKIKEEFDKMWVNVKTWVIGTGIPKLDELGGSILNAVAGWFKPRNVSGQTEAYNGMRYMFTGGAQKGITAGVDALTNTFPEIAAGLQTMVDSIGNWLVVEGVPTVSRSIGYFVGTMAVKFGELIGNIGNFITGGGAADAANGIKDATLDPALEGFNQAMTDNKVQKGADQFFTSLAGIFVAGAGITVFGGALIGKGFVTAIMSTLGTVLSGGGKLVGSLGKVGLGVAGSLGNALANTALGASITNGITNFSGSVMSLISDGLSAAASVGTTLWNATGGKIMAALGSALETKALQSMMLWDTVMGKIGTGLSAAGSKLTAVTGWVVKAAGMVVTPILTAIGAAFAAMPALPIILAGITIAGILSVIVSEDDKRRIGDAIKNLFDPDAFNKTLSPTVAFTASVGDLQLDFDNNKTKLSPSSIDSLNYFLTNRQIGMTQDQAISYSAAISQIVLDVSSGKISKEDAEPKIQTLVANAFSGAPLDLPIKATFRPILPTEDADVVKKVVPATTTEVATEIANDMLNPIWTQVAANIMTNSALGGSTDTTPIATSMTKPFVDQFTTAFGTEGTSTVKFNEFVNAFGIGSADVQNDIGAISLKITTLITDIDLALGKLAALVGGSPYKVEIEIKTNGTMPTPPASTATEEVDGSHAGGLNSVPFDNYRANLHKGEMVLSRNEAEEYRSGNALPRGSQNVNVDNSAPTFIINGVNDFDKFMKEAKRRGYNLDKYRR